MFLIKLSWKMSKSVFALTSDDWASFVADSEKANRVLYTKTSRNGLFVSCSPLCRINTLLDHEACPGVFYINVWKFRPTQTFIRVITNYQWISGNAKFCHFYKIVLLNTIMILTGQKGAWYAFQTSRNNRETDRILSEKFLPLSLFESATYNKITFSLLTDG